MILKAKIKVGYLLNGKTCKTETRKATLPIEENYPRKKKKAYKKHVIDFIYSSTGVKYK